MELFISDIKRFSTQNAFLSDHLSTVNVPQTEFRVNEASVNAHVLNQRLTYGDSHALVLCYTSKETAADVTAEQGSLR